MLYQAHSPYTRELTPLLVSVRDRHIIRLAQHKLRGTQVSFAEALRALQEAVAESIPAGRIFHLGTTALGPIVGSIISGVGVVASTSGVQLVRVERDGRRTHLGRFEP